MKLKLAEDLALPADEAVTQKYGFIGRSGSGKSYAAMKLAELFLEHGAQVIALDWVGIWWSLRLAADGKAPGFEHVYIFGGEHADVDLRPESGALMADLVVDKHISVVLDVMHFRKAERTRFATAFAEQFFHRKKTARTACHLFIEEAQAYLPQMVRGDEARMVGVFEDIGKVGRNYGIGNSLISQRPQAINKDVLNQVEVLLAFQTNGPQERKAIAGWTSENTDAGAALVQELPKLAVGHAQAWSPQWLRIAKQVHIAPRVTYNASATPTQKAKAIRPRTLAKSDLEQLGAEITATIEKAKADDPRELKKKIAELQKRVDGRIADAMVKAVAEPKVIEKPVLKDAQIVALDKAIGRLEGAIEKAADALTKPFAGVREQLGAMAAAVKSVRQPALPMPAMPAAAAEFGREFFEHGAREPGRRPAPAPSVPPKGGSYSGVITGPQQRILNALAWVESVSLPTPRKEKLAFLSDASPTSSSFTNNLGALRTAGLVDYPTPGFVALTDAGRSIAVVDTNTPTTSAEMITVVCSKVTGPQARIIRALALAYPDAIDKATLADRVEASASSSSFTNNLGALRSLGLLDYPQQGMVAAQPVLFLEGR